MLLLRVKFVTFVTPRGRDRAEAKGRYLLELLPGQRRSPQTAQVICGRARAAAEGAQLVPSDGWRGENRPCRVCPFLCAVVTVDRGEACIIFNHSRLLFENTSLPQKHSEPRPVVTFLS